MADTSVDRLFFELGIDPSGMAAGAARAQGIFGSLSKRAKITIGILGGFTAVFTAIAVKSVFAASKFQDAFNEVRTLIDETTTDSKLLRKEVLKLAAAVGRPPEEVSRGLYQVISAGVTDAAEAMAVLEVATRASIGGLTDQFTAVDAVTTVLNAYNLEASEAENVTDLMLNAVKEGKLTFSDLASNIGKVVSTAALAGIGFDEVSAALATMTKAGLSTELATTSLNTLLLKIIDSGPEVQQAAEDMGLEWNLAALRARGLTGLMKDLSEATGGNVEELKSVVKELEAFKGASILAGTGLDEFTRIMGTTKDVTGTTQEFFVKIKQSISETAKEISTRLNVAFINLGTKILPAVAGTLEGILDLLDRFTKTDIQKQVDALEKITGTEALIRRLQLTERIESEEQKRITSREKLNSLIKDGGRALLVNQNVSLKTGTVINKRAAAEVKIAQTLTDIAQEQDAINKLSQIESDLIKSIGKDQITISEARAKKESEAVKFTLDQQKISKDNLVKVRELLLLLEQESESKEVIKKAEEEILALLGDQGEQETKNKEIKEEVTKSITKQQEELKNQIRIIEEGAASEIALIELTGKVEKLKTGEIKAEVVDLQKLTAARLSVHLGKAIEVYGIESEFVKQLKISILKLKEQAEEEIEVTLKTDLVLAGIDKSSRAIAGLSKQLFGLSDSGELTIRRIGAMAGGMLDLRKAFSDTKGDLLNKFLPALGLMGTGISLLSVVMVKSSREADRAAQAIDEFAESMRDISRTAALAETTDIQQVREQAAVLLEGFAGTEFGRLSDEQAVVFGRLREILGLLATAGTEAQAKGLAQELDKFINENANIIGQIFDVLRESDKALVDDLERAFLDFENIVEGLVEALRIIFEEELADFVEGLDTFVDSQDDPDLPINSTVKPTITTDFRQFVGITELQGNVLLGILNTQTDIARQQLNLFQNNLDAISGTGSLTIEEFNFEVNFENVSLANDQNIQDVSEMLALETVDALRAVGG